jgi:tRNA-dihydrouridine synthase
MKWMEIRGKLKGKLFLSSMMHYTDGRFCSERGLGSAMVQIGAYLAEPPAYGVLEHGWVLPPNREKCVEFLRREIEIIRDRLKGVRVCLNLATPRLEWGLEAAECFKDAGGDLLELNFHGGYKRYLEIGRLRAMVFPENRSELYRWLERFSSMDFPVIAKFRLGVISDSDYMPILDFIESLKMFGVHFNIRDEKSGKPCFEFIRHIRKYGFFILASGYVRSLKDAEMLFESGADMVGLAEPVINNPNFIAEIAESLNLKLE